jgi:hypothetical protein
MNRSKNCSRVGMFGAGVHERSFMDICLLRKESFILEDYRKEK